MNPCSCGYNGEEGWDLWIVGPKGVQDGVFCPRCGKEQEGTEDISMPPKETKKVEFNVNEVAAALKAWSGYSTVDIKGVYVANLLHQWKPDFKEVDVGGVMTVVCEVK